MAEISINGYGLSTMCRLCLSRGVTVLDIFFFSTKMRNHVADVIMTCTPVKITKHEDMPNFVCRLCYTQLEKIHQFQMQVIQSDKTLRRYLQQLRGPDKQIKTTCSIQEPSDDPSIYKPNTDVTVKCESLELHNVIEGPMNDNCVLLSTECVDDTLSKDDCSEISCEDRKIDIGDIKLEEDANINWAVKEKFDLADKINSEMSVKSELPADDVLIQLGYIDDTGSASSNCDGTEISCEDTKVDIDHKSENFLNLRSAVVKHNKCEEENQNSSKHKKRIKITYQCDVCDKRFGYSHNLKRHKRIHTGEKPYNCDVCNKSFSLSTSLKTHQTVHTREKPFQCELCKKRFSYINGLKFHIRGHTGEKPYKCDVCNKYFGQSTHLKNHKRTHTAEKPYQCDVCNKSFGVSASLKNHQSVHTDEKPLECSICMKRFTVSRYLIRHKRTHTGVKPYKCDVCNKRFIESHSLKIHKRTHSDVKLNNFSQLNRSATRKLQHTDEKPYQCYVCNKSFKTSTCLKIHTRLHTGEKPYKCDICKKGFNQLSNLNYHKLTHTGEKPYQCDVCNKSFTLSRNLKIHERTHTGVKPYQCDICKKRFTVSSNFKVHKCVPLTAI